MKYKKNLNREKKKQTEFICENYNWIERYESIVISRECVSYIYFFIIILIYECFV